MLGILAINVTGFWGPPLASSSPIVPAPLSGLAAPGSISAFLAAFVLFEGKMRALFTLLFGASMLLFIAAAERRGASGTWLQVRRLLWLGAFGYLHYLLLWWGDILVTYALCGLFALALRRLQTSGLVAVALLALAGFAALDGGAALIGVAQDARVSAGTANAGERAAIVQTNAHVLAKMDEDIVTAQAPFAEAVRLSGWGLALGVGGAHPLPRGVLPLVVLAGWGLMLAWPGWWLARFGQGPLEALWRRLTWWGVRR